MVDLSEESVRSVSKSAKYADQGAKAPGNSMSPKHINVLEECQEGVYAPR